MENKLNQKHSLWSRIIEARAAYLMLLPGLIGFAVFTLYPNLWVARFSLFRYNGVTDPVFIGWENFVRVFTRDAIWWRSVVNTFVFTGGKLLIEIPLSLLFAVMLTRRLRGSNLFRGVLFLPNVTSAAVMSVVFSLIFAAYNGALNNALLQLGLIERPVEWLGTMPNAMIAVIITSTWTSIGLNTIFFMAGLQGIPEDVYESGDIDGATGWKRFVFITLPLLARMFQLILMLAIIGSLQMFDVVQVLTNGGGPSGGTEMIMTYIYDRFYPPSYAANPRAEMGYGSALGVTATFIIGVVTLIYLYVSRKMDEVV